MCYRQGEVNGMAEQYSEQLNPLHDMLIDGQNDAIEACAVLAAGWPGVPPNLAAAIRTLKRETPLVLDRDHPGVTGLHVRASHMKPGTVVNLSLSEDEWLIRD